MKEQVSKVKNKKTMAYTLLMIIAIITSIVSASILPSISFGAEVAKISLEAKLDKYVNYSTSDDNKGTMVQYNLKSKMEYEDSYIPVKNSQLEVQINPIDGKYPYDVKTITKSTEATNGKTTGIEENYEYNAETGKLTIKTSNQNEKGELLKQEQSSPNTSDEYLIICYYDTYVEEEPERDLILDIEARATLSTNDSVTVDAKGTLENKVKENMGQLTSINHKTGDLYNGYIKSNRINGTSYHTQYKETQEITVSQKVAQEKIEVLENNSFVRDELDLGNNENLVYKSTKIAKEDLVKMLGEEGSIEILDTDRNVIATIDQNTQFDEDGTITIHYENEPEAIIIVTSDIQKEGILTLENTKEIKATMTEVGNIKVKTRNEITGIKQENVYQEEQENTVDIQEAQTNIDMNVSNTEWTNEQQNEITFDITLKANTEKDNMFKNPTARIELPSQVEKVILQNSGIFYANGLALQDVHTETNDNGNIVIVANIAGEQTAYDENALDLATEVKITATIILKKDIETTEANTRLEYTNQYTTDGSTETGSKDLTLQLENYREEVAPITEEAIDTYQTAKATENSTNIEGLKLEVAPVKGDEAISNGDTLYEGEYLKYNVKVTNTSDQPMQGVKIVGGVPEGATYGELEAEYYEVTGKYEYNFDNTISEKEIEVGTLKPGQSVNKIYEVQVNDLEEGQAEKEIKTNISAKIGDTEVANYELTNLVKPAEVKIFLGAFIGTGRNQWVYDLTMESKETKEVTVQLKAPKEYELQYIVPKEEGKKLDLEKVAKISEDNVITVKLKTNEKYLMGGYIEFPDKKPEAETSEIELTAVAKVQENNVTYTSNENRILYGYENVAISMTSDNEGEEVKYGDEINYEIVIKNTGRTNLDDPDHKAISVKASDFLPENVEPISVTYNNWEEERESEIGEDTYHPTGIYHEKQDIEEDITGILKDEDGNQLPNVNLDLTIPYQESVTIKVKALSGTVFEKTKVENSATVTGERIIAKTSNIVTHTILPFNLEEEDPNNPDNPENPNDPSNPTTPGDNNEPSDTTSEKHSISGVAWLDENEDGQRQTGEKKLSGITVTVVDAQNANIVKDKIQTDSEGAYQFEDLEKGNYIVLFQYDTNTYRVTEYQKTGVPTNANSDAITRDVTLNGETMKAGMIEVSNLESSVSNMDIGLIQNKICDFKLDKSITKVTVTTKNGTKQYNYQNEKLAKVEIKAKEIEGATVVVEYKIVVTNEGELASTVGKVIDYLPEGLTFSSELNKNWAAQTNGQLINTSISNRKIEPGESVELTLIATKKMTANSTGTFTNAAEIGDITNSLGIADKDSTPGNQVKTEDDYSQAEVIISVSTGMIMYLSIGAFILIIIGAGVFVASKGGMLKLGKKSLFMALLIAMIVSGSRITEAVPNQAYFEWDPNGPSNAYGSVLFHGYSGTGDAYCVQPGAAAISGTFYLQGISSGSTTTQCTRKDDITINMTKLNDDVEMRAVGNDYVFGPLRMNCSYDGGYQLDIRNASGGAITQYTVCDQNGNATKLAGTGNITFYVRIPSSVCQNGVSKIKVSTTRSGKQAFTSYTYGYAYYAMPGGQDVVTYNKFLVDEREWEEPIKTEKSIEWTNIRGAIEIIKEDADDAQTKLEGVKIRIQCAAIGYDQTFTTDAQGRVYVENLPANKTYTVSEVEVPQYGYFPDAKGSVSLKCGMKYEYHLKNIKQTGNLKIEKKDKDAGTPLEGMGFKIRNAEGKYIVAVDANGNTQTRVTGTIYLGGLQYASSESGATEFITDSNGKIEIYNILIGNYTVIETTVGDKYYGYEIDDDYITWSVSGGGSGKGRNVQVNVARQKSYDTKPGVRTENATKVTVYNERKYIKLSGYVWLDQIDGKTSERTGLFKDTQSVNKENGGELPDTKDLLFNGITVRLKEKQTGNVVRNKDGQLQETVTSQLNHYTDAGNNGNGEYLYEYVLKREIDKYYVEFEYDGFTYTNVIPNLDKNNGSKAAEGEQNRDEFNKGFSVVEGRTRDTGITKDANGNEKYNLNYDVNQKPHEAILTNNGEYEVTDAYIRQKSIGQFIITATTSAANYNIKDHYVLGQDEVRYINLGLYEREQPDIALVKDIHNVRVGVNGYEHTYFYSQRFINMGEYGDGFNVGVKFGSKYGSMSYSRAIYKADYEYINENNKSKELKVYVTYQITMRNQSSNLITRINNIVDYYDSKYQIVNIGTSVDEKGNVQGNIEHTETPYDNNYTKSMIYNNTRVEAQKEESIYVQFELNREAVLNILNDQANLDNIAEINSYSVFDGDKVYAGIDKDSNPGNSTLEDRNTYEDDIDRSPGLKLEVADAREIGGKVFLDETTGELMTGQIRQGSGAYEEGEKGIPGVEITFTENTGSGKVYKTTTDENGDFSIASYIPGDYTLTYTWGDETYTVQKYKGTIYDKTRDQSNKKWYKENVETRLTDAIDDYNTRLEIDNEIKKMTHATQITKNKMDSTTPTMGIGVEYESVYTASSGDRYVYKVNNIDFGIVERARQDLSLSKRVTRLKATLANGQVIVNLEIDENGNITGEKNGITYMKPDPNMIPNNGFVRLELDNELIQGTILEIEYEIKATNQSELDYLSENYYKYGIIEGEIVTIEPTGIIDYLDGNWAFDSDNNPQWEGKTLENFKDLVSKEVYENEESEINNRTILYTESLKGKYLKPIESATITLNTSKILTTTDEIALDNETEVVELNKTGGAIPESTPGNYIPGAGLTESDDSMAETTIVTPATGDNLNYIIPIAIGITACIILGAGVVVIKKKILSE